MRFYEISSGVRIPVSEEEQEILDLLKNEGKIKKSALDERQQEVARLMVGRGVLSRSRGGDDSDIIFRPNGDVDIWRL